MHKEYGCKAWGFDITLRNQLNSDNSKLNPTRVQEQMEAKVEGSFAVI